MISFSQPLSRFYSHVASVTEKKVQVFCSLRGFLKKPHLEREVRLFARKLICSDGSRTLSHTLTRF
jgi:hypothetical protein